MAWCVLWEHPGDGTDLTGLIDPFQFNVVFINQASGWNEATSKYTVPLAGVYYVQITAGIFTRKPTKMELLLNGDPLIHVYRQFTVDHSVDTRSNAIIVRLHVNDELRIRLPAGYYTCIQTEIDTLRLQDFAFMLSVKLEKHVFLIVLTTLKSQTRAWHCVD